MNITAVVGANWGDEGKGKVIDYLSARADMVIRFQGGQNAGHTIINSHSKFVMHLLPSGIFYPQVVNILGPGVALDMGAFLNELESLKKNNVPQPEIVISDRAQIVLPIHVLFDRYEEERLCKEKFGSTQKGIAPFYSDKYLKIGVPVADLFDEQRFKRRVQKNLVSKNVLIEHLYKKQKISSDDIISDLLRMFGKIKPLLADTTAIIQKAIADERHILLEGQLGALRDPDHGIYPFTTSSSTLAGFASVGAGIPPHKIKSIIAVTKAYSTCAGAGPFVTEMEDEAATVLRDRGGDAGEFGATTGRPRRMGWFDAVATRYGCQMQGATAVCLTMMDVLGYKDEIPICVAYKVNGKKVTDFPAPVYLDGATPVYEYLKGWKCDVSGVRRFEGLPENARKYIKRIEQLIQVPIKWISVGPKRDAMIVC